MEPKIYECKICRKIIAVIKDPGTPTYCCGEEMEELIPGIEDGDAEKHVPVIKTTDALATVDVGTKEHPSSMEHYIEWIMLVTSKGIYRKNILPGEKPRATFPLLPGEEVYEAFAYCNIHKLWKQDKVTEIPECC